MNLSCMCTPLDRVKTLKVIYVISQYFSVPARNEAAPRLCILSLLIAHYGVCPSWIMCANIYYSSYIIIHSIRRDGIQIAFFSLSNFMLLLKRICTRKISKKFSLDYIFPSALLPLTLPLSTVVYLCLVKYIIVELILLEAEFYWIT
jgi:hypothetical protein